MATIKKIAGRLMRVRLESFEEELEQWMDVFSPDVYPVGWCQTFGHPLEAPRPKSHSLNIFLFDGICIITITMLILNLFYLKSFMC